MLCATNWLECLYCLKSLVFMHMSYSYLGIALDSLTSLFPIFYFWAVFFFLMFPRTLIPSHMGLANLELSTTCLCFTLFKFITIGHWNLPSMCQLLVSFLYLPFQINQYLQNTSFSAPHTKIFFCYGVIGNPDFIMVDSKPRMFPGRFFFLFSLLKYNLGDFFIRFLEM